MLPPLSYSSQIATFDLCSDDSSLSWVGLAWSLGTVRQSYLKRCWLLSEKKGDLRGDHRFAGEGCKEEGRACLLDVWGTL